MPTKRFTVEYAHELCHPETCCHEADWRIYDDTEKRFIEYSNDRIYLEMQCNDWNKKEVERQRVFLVYCYSSIH